MGSIQKLHRAQMGVSGVKYIEFADPEVFRILMANGVSSNGVGITLADVEKVTSIGTWFNGNTEITSFDELRYFTALTAISYSSFQGCTSLVSVAIPCVINDSPNAGYGAFLGCSSLQNVTFTSDSISKIGDFAFMRCTSLETITLPSESTNIGRYAFYEDMNLASVENWNSISSKIVSIGSYAFYQCPLSIGEDLILPNLETLGGFNFNKSSIVRVLDLGKISVLGRSDAGLFSSALTNLIIFPDTLTTIESYALYTQTALRMIVCKANTPPSLGNGNSKLANCIIYVPDIAVANYQASTNWDTHSTRIKGISSLQTDNPTLYNEIKDYL